MQVLTLDRAAADWEPFIARQAQACIYHHPAWATLVSDVFGLRAWYIEARDEAGQLLGVLPLVRQVIPLLGSYLTSMPYFNYGGALAATEPAREALMSAARELAQRLNCRYLELRDTQPAPPGWHTRTDKITMVLALPADHAALAKQLGAKLRSQTRRAEREGATTHTGGLELLDDFYDVFCHTMHALGTPVYPKRFFAALLQRFAHCTALVVIRANTGPMAAGLLVFDGTTAEIPWAGCREDAKPLGFNMKLYLEVLQLSIDRGCTRFDFGRTTPGSGTWRFKAQWGAQPVQLHWHRWQRGGAPHPQVVAQAAPGKLRQLVTRAWSALPLPVANTLGPLISPVLPW